MSVVRIRESPRCRGFFFLRKYIRILSGTLETVHVRNREVSVPRGSSVLLLNLNIPLSLKLCR